MNEKKWTITLLSAVAITLIGFACVMYWLDPLLHYGAESGPLTCYEYSEMYSNPGIAKHYEYDTVMVGTSMIQNTDVDLCMNFGNVIWLDCHIRVELLIT